jgi:peptidoglycan/xylan/chitin deacetylase (PgdA/CDA1 family)
MLVKRLKAARRSFRAPGRVLAVVVLLVLGSAPFWACSWPGSGASTTAPPTSEVASATKTSATKPSTTSTGSQSSVSAGTTGAVSTTTASSGGSGGSDGSPGSTSTTRGNGRPAMDYTKLPTTDRVVALTFDAAYDPSPLSGIMKALKDAGATATFFLTGEFVEDFPTQVDRIVAAGYPIGNHSFSHPDFTKLADAQMKTEIRTTAQLIKARGAADPRPLFRAPSGALDRHVLSVLGAEGYVSVFWTIDTLDWKPDRTATQIEAAVLDKLSPGAIVLMHVGGKQTAQALPAILDEIKARGYSFVTLREAIPRP